MTGELAFKFRDHWYTQVSRQPLYNPKVDTKQGIIDSIITFDKMNNRTFNYSDRKDALRAMKKEDLVEMLLTGKGYMVSRQQAHDDISVMIDDDRSLLYPCIFTPRKEVSQHHHPCRNRCRSCWCPPAGTITY
jgi:hypothetical protein